MKFVRFAIIGAAAVSATSAFAQSSSSCADKYEDIAVNTANNTTPPHGFSSWLAYFTAEHPECFSGSSSAAQAQISGTVLQQVSTISSAISGRFSGGGSPPPAKSASIAQSGMAAGAPAQKWNAWGSVSQSDTRQRYTLAAGGRISNDSDIQNFVLGGDYAFSSDLVTGVSLALDRGNNSTAAGGRVSTTEGHTLAPYVGWQINKDWALDASIGFGEGKLSAGANSETKSDRMFAGVNVNFNRWNGAWQYSAKAGYIHAEEDSENIRNNGAAVANTASKAKMDRLQAGAQVGYWMNNGIMPYAGLTLVSDHRSVSNAGGAADPIGKSGFQWTVGANFFSLASGVTGGVAYTQEDGRSNQKNNVFAGNINVRF